MNAPALVWMDELNAALDRAAHITPNAGRQLPNECDLFGVYVAAVKRARLAQGNPSAVNVERAKAARIAVDEVLEVSPSTNPHRMHAARLTLDLLDLLVTDAQVARARQ